MRTFRDYGLGDRERLGPILVDAREAQAFAARFDPQPFHLSEAGADGHPFFERMSCSGWFTAGLMVRLMVDEMQANPVASVGSPGVERMRWKKPVYPGDSLLLETEVTAVRQLASRPQVGLVTKRLRTWNQRRELVMTAEVAEFVAVESALPERRHLFHPA